MSPPRTPVPIGVTSRNHLWFSGQEITDTQKHVCGFLRRAAAGFTFAKAQALVQRPHVSFTLRNLLFGHLELTGPMGPLVKGTTQACAALFFECPGANDPRHSVAGPDVPQAWLA